MSDVCRWVRTCNVWPQKTSAETGSKQLYLLPCVVAGKHPGRTRDKYSAAFTHWFTDTMFDLDVWMCFCSLFTAATVEHINSSSVSSWHKITFTRSIKVIFAAVDSFYVVFISLKKRLRCIHRPYWSVCWLIKLHVLKTDADVKTASELWTQSHCVCVSFCICDLEMKRWVLRCVPPMTPSWPSLNLNKCECHHNLCEKSWSCLKDASAAKCIENVTLSRWMWWRFAIFKRF